MTTGYRLRVTLTELCSFSDEKTLSFLDGHVRSDAGGPPIESDPDRSGGLSAAVQTVVAPMEGAEAEREEVQTQDPAPGDLMNDALLTDAVGLAGFLRAL
jgi:hypothetical protein